MIKRLFLILIIACMPILLFASCSSATLNEDSTDESVQMNVLKDNISALFEEPNAQLEIKQVNGNFYKASPEFAIRILRKLKSNRSYTPFGEIKEMSYNVVLKFAGYKELYLNTDKGNFWMADGNQAFDLSNWSEGFWDRHVLKEIEGEILYYSFEKDVIERTFMDVDYDEDLDEVTLFYDGDIRLKVKNAEIVVMEDVDEEMISSLIPSNKLESHLHIEKDEKSNSFAFLVGSRYSFTNKYGSTSWLSCFKYKDGVLSKQFDSDEILNGKVLVKNYKNDIFTIYIEGFDKTFDVKLTQEEIDNIAQYLEFLKERDESFIGRENYLFLPIMPQYKFYDYDNDGKEEVIARFYMRGGAPGITDQLISVFDFNEEGLVLRKLLSGRENKELVDMLY